jgi:hypothetical protein
MLSICARTRARAGRALRPVLLHRLHPSSVLGRHTVLGPHCVSTLRMMPTCTKKMLQACVDQLGLLKRGARAHFGCMVKPALVPMLHTSRTCVMQTVPTCGNGPPQACTVVRMPEMQI